MADKIEISPRTGTAFTLNKGQRLTVIDPKGVQVSDLVAFNRHDPDEVISNGRTLDYASRIFLTTDDPLYSNRSNVMLKIVADNSPGKHDFLLTPCSKDTFRIIYGDKKYDEHKGDKKYDDHKEEYHHDDGKTHGLSAFPFDFTSTYYVKATPDNIIVANGSRVPGQEGAVGHFSFGINSKEEVICYNITLIGVTGEYQSPAATATHVHESAAGKFGPPRLAFPNPTGDDYKRTSFGCLKGPFRTGLNNTQTGLDTATGFSLSQIEANPAGFAADTHTSRFVAGAVRGQLQKK